MLEWLESIPPLVIYLAVGVVIGLESLGIPLPGEILLVAASIAASQEYANPVWVAVAAMTGAIVGDSIGYAIGKRRGRQLMGWLGTKFPKHFSAERIDRAERIFRRWGAAAVFGGRFVALLRILAGPISGILRMPYGRFLAANAAGGILWSCAVTAVGYFFGLVAEQWIRRFSWFALLAVVVVALAAWLFVRYRRTQSQAAERSARHDNRD